MDGFFIAKLQKIENGPKTNSGTVEENEESLLSARQSQFSLSKQGNLNKKKEKGQKITK